MERHVIFAAPCKGGKLPFQIGVAGSRFAKPFVKISKSGSHLLMDDCPTNWKL